MYKVFVNKVSLFFVDTSFEIQEKQTFNFNEIASGNYITNLFVQQSEQVFYIACKDLENDFKTFQSLFTTHIAAGGLVFSKQRELLWIYRNNTWDLPKGHQEVGESIETCAIREVEEECGVNGLSIVKALDTTFHMYPIGQQMIFKVSHWFEMNIDTIPNLTPQIEEGITEVVFKNQSKSMECLNNTYQNIKLLIEDIAW